MKADITSKYWILTLPTIFVLVSAYYYFSLSIGWIHDPVLEMDISLSFLWSYVWILSTNFFLITYLMLYEDWA